MGLEELRTNRFLGSTAVAQAPLSRGINEISVHGIMDRIVIATPAISSTGRQALQPFFGFLTTCSPCRCLTTIILRSASDNGNRFCRAAGSSLTNRRSASSVGLPMSTAWESFALEMPLEGHLRVCNNFSRVSAGLYASSF